MERAYLSGALGDLVVVRPRAVTEARGCGSGPVCGRGRETPQVGGRRWPQLQPVFTRLLSSTDAETLGGMVAAAGRLAQALAGGQLSELSGAQVGARAYGAWGHVPGPEGLRAAGARLQR